MKLVTTITVDTTSILEGTGSYIQMSLQDLSKNSAIYNRYFMADCSDTQKWIFTVPDGSDVYAVYLYAGTKGNTADVSVNVENIILEDGIVEDETS